MFEHACHIVHSMELAMSEVVLLKPTDSSEDVKLIPLPELRATIVAVVMMQLFAQLKTRSVLTIIKGDTQLPKNTTLKKVGRQSFEVVSIINNIEDATKQDGVDTLGATWRWTQVLVCQSYLKKSGKHKRLSNCSVKLKTVSGALLCVAGQINMKVQDKDGKMRCLVVLVSSPNLGSSFAPLPSQSWLDALFPSWRQQWCKMIQFVSEREDAAINCGSYA
ncbi:hypothetical protein PR048_018631 [Dryococelus australis]|uniref:Uncharacterized protein n=1 Tax=Dryococelus australis TaxID=614101 RepID=A0ABQ9HDJ9_9NEOP|nr:hypothetical protein PR048_018631 [Dryococelus australis]